MTFRDLTADEIEVRVQSIKARKGEPTGAILLLYKNARCDMNILDETVGAENWQREHYDCKGNLFCRVGIKCESITTEKSANLNDVKHVGSEWVYKSDCGIESNTDAQKGEASDSFKRACFNWGIGRELYTSPFIWITPDKCEMYDTGRKDKYGNPIFATNDRFSVEKIIIENKKITALSIWNDTQNGRAFVWQMQK